MSKDPSSPATTGEAYDFMVPYWQRIDTLLAGTDAMRAAGEEYLPRHCEESTRAYAERLSKTTLLNMLQFTIDGWVGKPFNKPIQTGEDIPPQIRELLDNVDLQGNDINVFARNWFKDGIAKGLSHVLVDFPIVDPNPNGQPRTLADDRDEKLRPYLVHVRPENLIFAYAETVGGVERLLHVRIRERVCRMVGFTETYVTQIRVIEPGVVKIYEERKQKGRKVQWVKTNEYTFGLDFIPLVTFYADRAGFMLAKPPLSDLADLNIRHWQSTSDQIAVLTVARFPILACSGAVDDGKLTIGPNQWLSTPQNGRFYYVEHTGKAIEAGRKDLLDLEESMAGYGATFLQKRPGGASATARALDVAETTSPLQDMSIRFRDALEQAMQFFADWLKLEDGGTYTVTTDFGLSQEGGQKLMALKDARTLGDISRATYLSELKRFGVLNENFKLSVNEAELSKDPPVKGTLPGKEVPNKGSAE